MDITLDSILGVIIPIGIIVFIYIKFFHPWAWPLILQLKDWIDGNKKEKEGADKLNSIKKEIVYESL